MNTSSLRLLRIFCTRHATLNGLMNGTLLNDQLSVPLVERYVAALEKDGLIEAVHSTNGQHAWTATPMGHTAALDAVITSARTHGNYSMPSGSYVPPKWSIRSGGDEHLKIKSRGIDA